MRTLFSTGDEPPEIRIGSAWRFGMRLTQGALLLLATVGSLPADAQDSALSSTVIESRMATVGNPLGAQAAARDPEVTLAARLSREVLPPGLVVLSVSPESARKSPSEPVPEPGASLERIAHAYGEVAFGFGNVLALAPPTRTAINANPTGENVYANMPAGDVFKLLLVSLTDRQWQTLTGTPGLGFSDLDPEQASLFRALLPQRQFDFVSMTSWNWPPQQRSSNLQSGPEALASAHIRLVQAASIMLPDDQDPGRAMGLGMDGRPGLPKTYAISIPATVNEPLAGVWIRSEVPNSPRPGQLPVSDARLATTVSVDGLKTVGDLVNRVARRTAMELYIDRRYETHSLSLLPASGTARARDLLQALALGLRGTFRKVGPAYVLTDDLSGAGTRREVLERFLQRVKLEREKALKPARDRILKLQDRLAALPFADTSLRIPPDEMKLATRGPGIISNAILTIKAPIEALTPAQQAVARQMYEAFRKQEQGSDGSPDQVAHPERYRHVTLHGDIEILSQPAVLLSISGVDGPVDITGYVGGWDLAHSTPAPPAGSGMGQSPKPPSSADLASKLARIPRRAVLLAPGSLVELDDTLTEMQRIGLNELWLELPSPGSAHAQISGEALLDEARKLASGLEVKVLPAVDLLHWDLYAPQSALDFTLVGTTSVQAMQEAWTFLPEVAKGPYKTYAPPHWIAVSPFADVVNRTLVAEIQRLADRGTAGMVWLNANLPGYAGPDGWDSPGPLVRFGYNIAGRLSFLRSQHVDPIDIDMRSNVEAEIQGPFPFWDTPGENERLRQAWNDFRSRADLAMLQRLTAMASTASGGRPIPILLRPSQEDPYVEWSNSRVLPSVGERTTWAELLKELHGQSRQVMAPIIGFSLGTPGRLEDALQALAMPPSWGGIVFDLTGDLPIGAPPSLSSGLNGLKQLDGLLHGSA